MGGKILIKYVVKLYDVFILLMFLVEVYVILNWVSVLKVRIVIFIIFLGVLEYRLNTDLEMF